VGGSTQKAPKPFKPPNQAGSAAAFQAGAGALSRQGGALYGQTAPELAQISQNVMNNPYYQQAMQGAQSTAGAATGMVAPQQFGGAAQDTAIANLGATTAPGYANAATGVGSQAYGQTQSLLPSSVAGLSMAPDVFNQAQSAVPTGTSAAGLAPGAYGAATSLIPGTTGGSQLAPAALMGAVSMIDPTTMGGLAAANPTLFQGLMNAGQSWQQSQGALGNVNAENANLMGEAGQTLNTAYDPQQALYDRSYQQMVEQQNAINAQSGVSGSPFAAGLTGDAARNFNIDWQNAQLNRQIAGLGAYGGAAQTATGDINQTLGQAASDYSGLTQGAVNAYTGLTSNAAQNYANLSNAGVGQYNALNAGTAQNLATLLGAGTSAYNTDINSAIANLANLQSTGVGNFNALTSGAVGNAANLINTGTGAMYGGINTGVGALSNLGQLGIAGNQAASDLGTAGLNTMAGAAQLPSDVYLQQQQAGLGALGAQITGSNAAATQTQQAIADQGAYLGIGQQAAQGAINAAQVNNQAAQASAAGFGNLFGTIAGMFSSNVNTVMSML